MLKLDGVQFNQVTFDGADMKRIILDDENAWAQEYSLSVQKSDTSISLPDGYLLWTTKTDPSSGNDTSKCHFGEVIETVFCDNGWTKVALPTGTYSITGPTTIPATTIRFSAEAGCDVEPDSPDTLWLSIQNPYYSDNHTIKKIPQDYQSSYRLYVQWITGNPSYGYFQGDAGHLVTGSAGYNGRVTGGFYLTLEGLANMPDDISYYITVRSGEGLYARCTQVIEIDGMAAIRQNFSREASEVFDTTELVPDLWASTNEDLSWS